MVRYRINLGALVLFSTVFLVLLFGSINYYWVRREVGRALARELEVRAVHHAQSLALQTAETILLEDTLRLKQLIEETRSLDLEIAYIFLVGPRGQVAAHTFPEGFPLELLEKNPLPPDRNHFVRRVVDRLGKELPARHVVAPIAGGYAGFAHVGLREDLILAGAEQVGRAVGWMVAVCVGLGLLASLLFARVVTRPLRQLAAASEQVSLEMLDRPLGLLALRTTVPWLETEVDRLHREFRRMVERLSAAYQQLRKTQEQLVFAERLGTLGTVAAGLAHELNNPLAGLRNCLRRIQREPENREQLVRYLAGMQESVDRMQGVLQGLLDLARPRRGEWQAVAVKALLERTALLAGHRLTEGQVDLRREVGLGVSTVWGDPGPLEQVLLNLVLNACDSLEQRRGAEPGFSPRLVIRAGCDDGRVRIEVEDNGAGIDPQNLPRLFDPFFTTKGPGRGTGLGLSIATNIIQEHGGKIEVQSEPGAGATFRILLEARPARSGVGERPP